ncbi:MAG TPA: hypothetical protein DEB39_00620 [Planctomycetaceae bacterium]|nr:hypothetical protein [Planctomycetaceae bacterium]
MFLLPRFVFGNRDDRSLIDRPLIDLREKRKNAKISGKIQTTSSRISPLRVFRVPVAYQTALHWYTSNGPKMLPRTIACRSNATHNLVFAITLWRASAASGLDQMSVFIAFPVYF